VSNDVYILRPTPNFISNSYDASPLITVENQHVADAGNLSSKFVHDPPLCEECRIKRCVAYTPVACVILNERFYRKTDYDLTEITIRVLGGEDPDPTPDTYTKNPVMIDSRQTTILTYRSRNAEPQRQSKRIRTVKRRVRRIGISKSMSVKDIKLQVCHALRITEGPPFSHARVLVVAARRAGHSDHLSTAVLSRPRAVGQQRERGGAEHPSQRHPRPARGRGERRAPRDGHGDAVPTARGGRRRV